MTDDPALRIYTEHASALTARWQAASNPAEVFAPVADLLPASPQRIADIGAGPGREAVWLAGLGHDVKAVEPVAAFRDIGDNDPEGRSITWLDDRLPDLAPLRALPPFGLLLLSGVWHHVAPALRARAMSAMTAALRPQGRMLISLRQGPDDPSHGLYSAWLAEAEALAAACGLLPVAAREAPAIQQQNRDAGVHWIWLALNKPA